MLMGDTCKEHQHSPQRRDALMVDAKAALAEYKAVKPKAPCECTECGVPEGPDWDVDGDCPGWICGACYRRLNESRLDPEETCSEFKTRLRLMLQSRHASDALWDWVTSAALSAYESGDIDDAVYNELESHG